MMHEMNERSVNCSAKERQDDISSKVSYSQLSGFFFSYPFVNTIYAFKNDQIS